MISPSLSDAAAFMGRDREMATLMAMLDATIAGRGSIALITGEPGIGKTRLAAEFGATAARRGVAELWGRCYEGEGAPSYAPWTEAFSAHVATLHRAELRARLGDGAATLAQLLPAVRAAFPDLPNPAAATPDEGRLRLFDAAVQLLLASARAGPLLLVLDDIHWADRASLGLLRHLAHFVPRAALLVVGAYREEDVHPGHPLATVLPILRHEAPCERLSLRGLGPAEACAYAVLVVEQAAGRIPASSETERGAARLDDALADVLARETDGNPFYIGEVLRHLLDDGRLIRHGDHWIAATPPEAWGVPEGVRQVIDRRLARLPAAVERLLRDGCAFTAGFDFAEARALTGLDEETLLDSFDVGLGAHLLRVVDPAATPVRYDFAHALIRHALYQALNPDRRARLHLRAAEALERAHAGNLDAHVAALAAHYRLAGPAAAPEKTIEYARRAGEAARAAFAYEDAVAQWQAALAVMQAHAVEAERRAGMLERLGDLMYVTGLDFTRGIDYLEEALKLHEALGRNEEAADIHARLGRAFVSAMSPTHDVARALAHYRVAEQILGSGPDRPSLVRLYDGLAWAAHYRLRIGDGLAASDRAVEIAERLGDEPLRAQATIHRGWNLVHSGALTEGLRLLERAWEIADQSNQTFAAFLATVWRANTSYCLFDPGEAREWLERELAKPRLAQAPILRGALRYFLGETLIRAGQLAAARRQVPELNYQVGAVEAAVELWAGDCERAERLAMHERERYRRMGNRWFECQIVQKLARTHHIRGNHSQAGTLLREALAMVEGESLLGEMQVRPDLALLYVEVGRPREAQPHLLRCREISAQGEDWCGLAGRVMLAEAAVSAAEGRLQTAEEQFEQAVTTFRRYAVPGDEAQALEWWGYTLLVAGGRAGGDERLDAAAAVYRQHGAGAPWQERLARLRQGATRAAGPAARTTYPGRLSEREVEVLRLIAAGKSNQEIADALVLSVRTVERHIARIYDKIGASGKSARAVAAAYALAHRLASVPGLSELSSHASR